MNKDKRKTQRLFCWIKPPLSGTGLVMTSPLHKPGEPSTNYTEFTLIHCYVYHAADKMAANYLLITADSLYNNIYLIHEN